MTLRSYRNLGSCRRIALFLTVGMRAATAEAVPSGAASRVAAALAGASFETLGIGSHSGCAHAAKMVIANEAEWRRVWHIHTSGLPGGPALPEVDFSHQVVAAVLLGEQSGKATSVEIAQVVSGPRETVVYYDIDRDAQPAPSAAAAVTQPFHFAAIERPPGEVRFVDAMNETCTSCGH